jgi:hypothetical protein
MIFAELQETNGETFLVITVISPKAPNQITPTEVPHFTIFIDKSWTTHDYITPAITDITTRTFTDDQIKLITECPEAPKHLQVETNTTIEAAHAANQNLILVTQEPDSPRNQLTILNTTSGQEFKAENQIELTDALSDFIKPLKLKAMLNIRIQIEFETPKPIAYPIDFVADFNLESNIFQFGIVDLPQDTKSVTKLRAEGPIKAISYSYDDLTIARQVRGGQAI